MPTTTVIACRPHRPATARERQLAAAGYLGGSYTAIEKEHTTRATAPATS